MVHVDLGRAGAALRGRGDAAPGTDANPPLPTRRASVSPPSRYVPPRFASACALASVHVVSALPAPRAGDVPRALGEVEVPAGIEFG